MAINLDCFGPFISVFKKLFESPEEETITGFAVIQKKNVLDLLQNNVSLQLISTSSVDPSNGSGKLGEAAFIQKWKSTGEHKVSGESKYRIDFKWDSSFGTPGAFLGNVHFVCNSYVYPVSKYKTDRIFFSNKSYLPADTPQTLVQLRNEELQNLRGNRTGKREYWDRIYDYDVYNDLGDPDKGEEYKRPVLGGSTEFPYPRRGRTGRHHNKSDPATESRICLLNMYVPRDERFGPLKMSDLKRNALKIGIQFAVPRLKSLFDPSKDFHSFEDVKKLYAETSTLFRHSRDEVYLGQRETGDWTDDKRVMEAFKSFSQELKQIEKKINQRNADESMRNRSGPARVPYTLLYPTTSYFSRKGELTGRGIPNSVSI